MPMNDEKQIHPDPSTEAEKRMEDREPEEIEVAELDNISGGLTVPRM